MLDNAMRMQTCQKYGGKGGGTILLVEPGRTIEPAKSHLLR